MSKGLFRKRGEGGFEAFKWTGLGDFSGTGSLFPKEPSSNKSNLLPGLYKEQLVISASSFFFFLEKKKKIFKHRKSCMTKIGKTLWVI